MPDFNCPLRIHRATEKLVSFHNYVLALIWFAYSTRMRSTFISSEIHVVPAKKKRPTPLTWPSTEKAWRDLLLSTYEKHELESENKPEVEICEKLLAKKAPELGVGHKDVH